MAKVGAKVRRLQRTFHDLADLFAMACIESRGLVSVLRDSWRVVERPETMIEPLRLSNVQGE